MKQFKHKIVIAFLFVLCTVSIIAQQKEYEIPTLDNGNVFNAKLSPDPKQKEVLSSYVDGKTTRDTLKIKIKGTYMVQNVMITVLCLDENENINVEIAKGNWKNIKRNGKTKNGIYQLSFKTARDFGIAIHSKKIGVPFNVVIWTSGELKPKTDNLFISTDEYKNKKNRNTSINNSEEQNNTKAQNKTVKSNFWYYIIVAVLVILAILLIMILKKSKNKTIGLFILLFTVSNMTFAQMSIGDVTTAMGHLGKASSGASTANSINGFLRDAENGESGYERLSDEDKNYEPNVDADGQPKLPSSCLNVGGNKNRPKRNNSRNTNRSEPTNEDDDNKYDDLDRPKYDEDGNAINYGDSNTSNNSQSDDPFTDDGVVVQGDGLKKDKDGNPIPGSAPSGHNNQVMDNEMVVNHNREYPKYDKDGKVIQYDTSNRPRYDIDGVTINYDAENDQTNYNREGRPKYDKDGNAIHYDNIDRPKYDKNGRAILYRDKTYKAEGTPENLDNVEVTNKKNEASQSNSNTQNRGNSSDNNTVENASNTNETAGNNQDNSEGCKCLEIAYADLEDTRYKFEKLRIIYTDTESFTKKQIAFGDDVSPATGGIGGLAWQIERKKILKSMNIFYKAYDNKYLQFVDELKDNLEDIEKCEAQLNFEDWYSQVGFLYFNFLKDKYKRN